MVNSIKVGTDKTAYQTDVGVNAHLDVFPVKFNASGSHPEGNAAEEGKGRDSLVPRPPRTPRLWSPPSSTPVRPRSLGSRLLHTPGHNELSSGPAQGSNHDLVFPLACIPRHDKV